ncbi:MAG: glycosyl hydrolase family 18 protein [Clostridia bacterium]
MKNVMKIIFCLIVIAGILFIFRENSVKIKSNNPMFRILINGDNIAYKEGSEPFYKDGGMYIPFETVKKTLDKNIFYDEKANKVIFTNKDKVIKYKVGEKNKTVNFKEVECKYPVIEKDSFIYIPVNDLKEELNIDIKVNENNKMVTILENSTEEAVINYSNVNVYTDMKTDSKVVKTLKYGEAVNVYKDKLKHARWEKVSTKDGSFGYMPKVEYEKKTDTTPNKKETAKNEPKEKVVMFWQQGNSVSVLGDKIDGVTTASPDWFDIENAQGDFTSKVSVEYLAKAKANGYELWPMFSNVNTTGATAIVSELVNSEENRQKAIENIVKLVDTYKLDGVNIDFENMKEVDKHLFTQFIRELAPLLKEKNVKLSVDIYLVNYVERPRIAEAADYIVVMAYDQHWSGSNKSGSVSEISWAEGIIKEMLEGSKIPAEKLILGVPFFTKVWEEKPGSKPSATNIGIDATKKYVSKNKLNPAYDEKSGQNYVEFNKGNSKIKLWIEDSMSIKKRAEFVKKYNLAGISAWQKVFSSDEIWPEIVNNIK